MRRSVKYGGFPLGFTLTGWVLANAMPQPSAFTMYAASFAAFALISWSAIWAGHDIRNWWAGRKEGELTSPPFVFTWRLIRDDGAPIRRLIPLHRAAIFVYPKLRDLTVVQVIFKMRPSLPERVPGIIAQLLLDEAVGYDFPVYGMLVPSEQLERIPEDDLKSLRISDDAKFMYDAFQGGFDGTLKPRYICLAMKKNDLKRRIKEIRTKHVSR
jgi:hypothetical protein